MERRTWPWKKKSSDKGTVDKTVAMPEVVAASLSSVASLGDQEKSKSVNYVQISLDSYTHLSGLEEQVKTLKEQLRQLEDGETRLKEKLSTALSEINSKENLIKQHAKVAEDAVAGWEKAEAEARLLKRQLESITLQKLSVEERASHLDGALKECTRQIRNVKEESEQKLQDVIFTQSKQWDKIKLELEKKMIESDQALLRAAAENAALSKSLQERSNLIVKMNNEKSKADAEIELLKEKIMSREKEINSLKYELHVISKELEIRNEEKNMCVKSAEAANRQHLEGVKKIVKLEAECQRLRGLVRKKLPGPAALAKMKMEVENWGQDFGESRNRSISPKNANSHLPLLLEIPNGNLHQSRKEAEFLTARLLAVEEETKMLKEALATRNSELQASRNICAEMNCRVKSLESQLESLNQQRSSESNCKFSTDSPRITLSSKGGMDRRIDSAESCASVVSEATDRSIDISINHESEHHLEFMDDFLEMERLVSSPNDAGSISILSNSNDSRSTYARDKVSSDAVKGEYFLCENHSVELESDAKSSLWMKLYSRIYTILEPHSKDLNISKVLEDIKCALKESLVDHLSKDVQIHDFCNKHSVDELSTAAKPELESALSQILQFVVSLGRKIMRVDDNDSGFNCEIEEFSVYVQKLKSQGMISVDFMLKLSSVLAKASELNFGVLDYKGCDDDVKSCDYIDKVALQENKASLNDFSKQSIDGCCGISHSFHNPEALPDKVLCPEFGQDVKQCKCKSKEFEELRTVRANLAMDLARCTEEFENTKSQLQETEQLLSGGKSELASSQRLCSLTETQLKCMTESYKSLELHAHELDLEVKVLLEKMKELDSELVEEKHHHQDTLMKCKVLEDTLQRNKACSICSQANGTDAEADIKSEQDIEIAAAAEKLAECQETIYLLGKQLQALHPKKETGGS